jgi:hypothetical protein
MPAPMCSPRPILLLVTCSPLVLGCGATTVRLELVPTVDSGGHVGFEVALGGGIGLPLDYSGRSHHFIQAREELGGGLDGQSRRAMFVTATDVDYVYWAEPRMDIRGGLRLSYRSLTDQKLYGLGARLGLLPIVKGDDGNWLVAHLCVGPELRFENLFGDPSTGSRGLFSVPLVIEGNFLAAGD